MMNTTTTIQNKGSTSGILSKDGFIIMTLIYNSNCILGAFADESTGIAEVDFQKTFGEKDIQ